MTRFTTASLDLLPTDLRNLESCSEAQISPVGDDIAYVVTSIQGGEWHSTICVQGPDRVEPRIVSSGEGHRRFLRWSPDGASLAFLLAEHSTDPSVLVVESFSNGESTKVAAPESGVRRFSWSRDSTRIAYSTRMPLPEAVDAIKSSPHVIQSARYKQDGEGYVANSSGQIFVVDLRDMSHKQLTHEVWDSEDACWCPCGASIAYTRSRAGLTRHTETDVWEMNADGSGSRAITNEMGRVASPSYSPDCSLIAFYAAESQPLEWGEPMTHVWVVPARGPGLPRNLTVSLDRGVPWAAVSGTAPIWEADGKSLLVPIADSGDVVLVRVHLSDDRVERVTSGGQSVSSVSAGTSGIAYVATDCEHPGDVYASERDGSSRRRISKIIEAWLNDARMPRIARRKFDGPNGASLDGWLLLPPGSDMEGPFPLLVDVHGGPHGNVGNFFLAVGPYLYRYVLPARGVAVLLLNATGSGSYGHKFAHDIRGHWGELDLPEHMAAIDELVGDGIVDPDRLAITGYSYGGYIAAWAVGNTERFRAAIVGSGISNLTSFYGTSDVGPWFSQFELLGDPTSQHERYVALSPVTHAHRSTTPTLILHGEDDDRVPVQQAEELFARLQLTSQATAEFVRYPGTGHGFDDPAHCLDYTERLCRWLKLWGVSPRI